MFNEYEVTIVPTGALQRRCCITIPSHLSQLHSLRLIRVLLPSYMTLLLLLLLLCTLLVVQRW